MFKRLLSVGGFTLLSRITGFVRDMLMAAILGKGMLSDAFIVAFLFPNYFRSIFGEGTINPAFLPRYAALHAKGEHERRALFGDSVFSWQMAAQLVILLAGAGRRCPGSCALLAPGLAADHAGAHHVSLARITFPYLILTVVGDPAFGDAERHREVLGRGRVVEFPQSRDDRDAAGGALVPQRRLCRRLGRAAGRRGAIALHAVGGARAHGLSLRIALAALDAGDQGILHGASARSPSAPPAI